MPDLAALEKNTQVQDAVVRNIEVIGEAVNNVQRSDPDFIRQHRQVPWAQMRAKRNVMIHEYFFLDLGTVWTTVKDDLPKLKQQIHRLLVALKKAGANKL